MQPPRPAVVGLVRRCDYSSSIRGAEEGLQGRTKEEPSPGLDANSPFAWITSRDSGCTRAIGKEQERSTSCGTAGAHSSAAIPTSILGRLSTAEDDAMAGGVLPQRRMCVSQRARWSDV